MRFLLSIVAFLILLSVTSFAQVKLPTKQTETKPAPAKQTPAKTPEQKQSYSGPVFTLKVITNTDCKFYVDGELKGIIGTDEAPLKINLKMGDYQLRAVSIDNNEDEFRQIYTVDKTGMEKFFEIDLKAITEERERKIVAEQDAAKKEEEQKIIWVEESKNARANYVMKLVMQADGGGSNGASVAYEPSFNRYYAVFAGNAAYPLSIFNEEGERINSQPLTALSDIRGLWYNSKTGNLEANCYDSFGVINYILDRSGFPVNFNTIFNNKCQPDVHSSGVYDPNRNEILYYYDGKVYHYNRNTGNLIGTLKLNLPDQNAINQTSIVYTGKNKQEIGLLNYVTKTIYLFDINTGGITKEVELPPYAPCESMFCFAYCNGYFWLFNKSQRAWYGYNY